MDDIGYLFEEEGLQYTNNPRDAVYILPNGKMISAHSVWQPKQAKDRDIEHRIIFSLNETLNLRNENGVNWGEALKLTGWIMLVPETKAIIKNTEATMQQEKILATLTDYEETRY